MKKNLLLFAILLCFSAANSQNEPWKTSQVMATKTLAEKIKTDDKNLPVIFNVGPMENIKGAIAIGAVTSEKGMNQLKLTAQTITKSKSVVVYCGCCSYANCPNIRPAFKALQDMGFKSVFVLDIPEGIKPDWVAKDYPMN